ncbi:hypothetical protein MSG28_012131 [Choristoneura fumiferana]|uniref:Uncharacterized protein n=1 Tax=Choristoneura fumiferana TaxID=7141 RepID=A0ACC0KCP5_CHOFU|nr:hypothetical protein MSG28_012131 [Choristoneura fumiferana]
MDLCKVTPDLFGVESKTAGEITGTSETCVLGGTAQANDFSTEIRPEDAEHILNGCSTMIPTLRGAKIVKQWTGLRPARREVRLEAEERDGRLVIHNYGHGGSGVTLFWGCASDVLDLLRKKINPLDTTAKSKL